METSVFLYVHKLGYEEVSITTPIIIDITYKEVERIWEARTPFFSILGYGGSKSEAVKNLGDKMLSLYEGLKECNDASLDDKMFLRKRILEHLLGDSNV